MDVYKGSHISETRTFKRLLVPYSSPVVFISVILDLRFGYLNIPHVSEDIFTTFI